jgi:hypothetical protein
MLYETRLKSSLQPSGAAIAEVYGDSLRLESIWNPYGLRIDSEIAGI